MWSRRRIVFRAEQRLPYRRLSVITTTIRDRILRTQLCTPFSMCSFIRRTDKAMTMTLQWPDTQHHSSLILPLVRCVCRTGKQTDGKLILNLELISHFWSQDQFENRYVDAVGWGTTSYGGSASHTLQKVTLQVISNADCSRYYGNRISIGLMCTYMPNRDACQVLNFFLNIIINIAIIYSTSYSKTLADRCSLTKAASSIWWALFRLAEVARMAFQVLTHELPIMPTGFGPIFDNNLAHSKLSLVVFCSLYSYWVCRSIKYARSILK